MNRAAYSAAFSTFGPSGRHRSAERRNGVKQPPTMPDQRDTKILEILGGQARQHSLVDLVIVEGRCTALEHAQEMAAHESPRTTKLYDRTKERLTQDEVERIRL
jgi:hypothetical protein